MKALVLKRYGGLDQVVFADIPKPALKPDEILVRVHAVGLNPVETRIPKGTLKPILRFQLPATPASDLAGVVVEARKARNRRRRSWRIFWLQSKSGEHERRGCVSRSITERFALQSLSAADSNWRIAGVFSSLAEATN